MRPGLANHFFAFSNKNDIFPFSGSVSLKSKNRFPIAFGALTLLTRRLTTDFQGRLARFTQMNFTPNEIYIYTLLDFMEFFRLGYSFGLVKTCW